LHGVAPRALSDLFYQRVLSDEACPVVEGRRIIPLSYLPHIEAALRVRGLIRKNDAAPAHISCCQPQLRNEESRR
jgi:hypothetical protein